MALLQRDVARPATLGVHLVHRRRRGAAAPIGGAARCSSRCTSRDGRRAASRAASPSSARALLHDRRRSAHRRRDASTVLPDGRYAVRGAAREEGTRHAADARSRRHAGRRRVLPRRDARRAAIVSGYVVPALRADATRHDLRRRAVRAIRRRPGVPRSQLGRVARRHLGVGRGARGRVHVPVRSRPAARQRRRGAAARSSTSSTRSASSRCSVRATSRTSTGAPRA